ncbi:GNAT family N-acetyltransferase [Candidatus Woesearchaeota archaeon]|nr:GNAT family N-acetyltransferase [Candidatus Woesearchaeota archaeon]
MKIRTLKKGDVKQIAILRYKLYLTWDAMDPIDKMDKKYFKSQRHYNFLAKWARDKNYLILVAEDDGKIVAFFKSYIMERAPYLQKVGYIAESYVDPKYRKKGIGAKMLDETRNWFKKNKLKWIVLSTHVLDKKANKFWKNRGFEEFNIYYKKRM